MFHEAGDFSVFSTVSWATMKTLNKYLLANKQEKGQGHVNSDLTM